VVFGLSLEKLKFLTIITLSASTPFFIAFFAGGSPMPSSGRFAGGSAPAPFSGLRFCPTEVTEVLDPELVLTESLVVGLRGTPGSPRAGTVGAGVFA